MKVIVFGPNGIHEEPDPDLHALLDDPQKTFWVDMLGPTPLDIKTMVEVFKFHPLAVEDTYTRLQRAKLEEYDEHLFIIINSIALHQREILVREIDTFVGTHFIVTVHNGPEPLIEKAIQRVKTPSARLPMSPGYLLYMLLDTVIDSFFPLLETIGEKIEELEDIIIEKPHQGAMNSLMDLKRSLRHLWQSVWPQQTVSNLLTHHNLPFIQHEVLEYYFRDVYDHVTRIAEVINTMRDTLTGVTDLYMSATSNRLNRIVNRLTVYTLAIGALTVIGGFYGMNFEHTWPAFDDPLGVPLVIVLMIAMVTGVLALLKRLKWY